MTDEAINNTSSFNLSLNRKSPVCLLVIGMAGAGKTSFVHRLSCYLHSNKKAHHVVNLDPAAYDFPYQPYIDIRDTINYKELMKQCDLGPNGAILAALNLFCTMFDDVMKLISKREDEIEFVIFDTPGQIEAFNISASGQIIAGSLAFAYPTIMLYVFDTPRSINPQTFMSNMLYACSILLKYQLPLIIAMNKIDIQASNYALTWISDYEEFQKALAQKKSLASILTGSLCLAIEEFYNNIKSCGVSSTTGQGMDEILEKVKEACIEYEEYRSEYMKDNKERLEKIENDQLKNINKDLKNDNLGLISTKRIVRKMTEPFVQPREDNSDEEHLAAIA